MLRNIHITLVFFISAGIASSYTFSHAADKSEQIIPNTTTCAGQALQLNGYGTRKKLFIKLYLASLYVQEQQSDAKKFLQMKQASCMRINITSAKITAEKMVKATREGFNKATQGNIEPIRAEIETFLAWLGQPIKKGDVFEFAFVPHNKTHIIKNNDELGIIESKEFSTALFGIWLGDMPVQQKLKAGLLGIQHTVQ